ncbi:unnamed protein product, partial [Schistosoma turkestanicum]
QGKNQPEKPNIHQTEEERKSTTLPPIESSNQREEDNSIQPKQLDQSDINEQADNQMDIIMTNDAQQANNIDDGQTGKVEEEDEVGSNETQLPQPITEPGELDDDELRLAHIPPIPEVPDELEENVLTYFDLREIHSIMINMDKDFSP